MDKVIVLGALEELGFLMTSNLLDEGYEVKGIHLHTREEASYDDRRLLIGRNANFLEVSLMDWLEHVEEIEQSSVVFVNYLDKNTNALLGNREGNEVTAKLQTLLTDNKCSMVVIFPFIDWNQRHEEYSDNTGCVSCFYVPHLERDDFNDVMKAIIEMVS